MSETRIARSAHCFVGSQARSVSSCEVLTALHGRKPLAPTIKGFRVSWPGKHHFRIGYVNEVNDAHMSLPQAFLQYKCHLTIMGEQT